MDFEEYWNGLASDPSDSEMLVMQCRFAAENAWYAAMSIEREACANVAAECETDLTSRWILADAADRIRARSNGQK